MMLPVAMSDHVAMSDRDDLDRAAEVYRGFRFALTKRGYRSGRRSSRTVGVVDADVLDGQHRLVAVGRATRSTAPLQKCHAPGGQERGQLFSTGAPCLEIQTPFSHHSQCIQTSTRHRGLG